MLQQVWKLEACDKKQQGKHGAWQTLLDSVQLLHCMLDWASSSPTSTQLLWEHQNPRKFKSFKNQLLNHLCD
jgi:hypothetical protein